MEVVLGFVDEDVAGVVAVCPATTASVFTVALGNTADGVVDVDVVGAASVVVDDDDDDVDVDVAADVDTVCGVSVFAVCGKGGTNVGVAIFTVAGANFETTDEGSKERMERLDDPSGLITRRLSKERC